MFMGSQSSLTPRATFRKHPPPHCPAALRLCHAVPPAGAPAFPANGFSLRFSTAAGKVLWPQPPPSRGARVLEPEGPGLHSPLQPAPWRVCRSPAEAPVQNCPLGRGGMTQITSVWPGPCILDVLPPENMLRALCSPARLFRGGGYVWLILRPHPYCCRDIC